MTEESKQEFMDMIGHSLEMLEMGEPFLSKHSRASIVNGILETISLLFDQREQADADAERLATELRLEQNPGFTCAALRAHEERVKGVRNDYRGS